MQWSHACRIFCRNREICYIGIAKPIDDKSAAGFTFIRFGVDDIPNTTQLIDKDGNINYDNITTFSAGDYAFCFRMHVNCQSMG